MRLPWIPFASCLIGFALGAVAAGLVLGRYSVSLTTAANGIGYVSRLDRWTGRTEAQTLLPRRDDPAVLLP